MKIFLIGIFCAIFSCIVSAQTFLETWASPSIGLASSCTGGSLPGVLPMQPIICSLPANAKYGTFATPDASPCVDPGPNGCYSVNLNVSPRELNFHGVRLPIISKATFKKDSYISAEAEVSAYCGPQATSGCFAGFTLINGENNYREIAYVNDDSSPTTMRLARYTPRQTGLLRDTSGNAIAVPRGTFHKLRIDYYGHQGGKWVYFVDDIVRSFEAEAGGSSDCNSQACQIEPSYLFTPRDSPTLSGDPHVAFYLVGNDFDETKTIYVEGSIRPFSVFTGLHQDQSQPEQSDGFGVSTSAWVAQLVPMSGANITMARLFLIPSTTYIVEARLNNGGTPGTLVNAVTYQTDRYGLQDVPLWVPSKFDNIWIVVKGVTTTPASVGVTISGQKPYASDYLTTTNNGSTWQIQPRNLTFTTFIRK